MSDLDSNDGRYLLLRTEFHGQSEYRTSLVIARRTKEDPDIPQSKLLMGKLSLGFPWTTLIRMYIQVRRTVL